MRVFTSLTFVIFALFAPGHSFAEESPPASDTQQQLLDTGQLDQLVAPVALYPDALLSQVLMASTYPLEVVQADRWAKANKSLKGDKLDEALTKQDWDASVKALVATPTVLAMMNDDLDWTEKLGDAVLAQQADVMDAIQRLRSKAQANGKLATTQQQTVTVTQEADKPVIVIAPASPQTVYVPYYEPAVVYGTWPYPAYPPYYFPPAPGYVVGGALARGMAWGAGFAIGNAIWDGFDWGHGNIHVDINKNVNINKHVDRNNVNVGNWQHNSYHRRGVSYNNKSVQNKFANADVRSGDRKLDYRGRGGEQVLKPGNKPGGGDRPNLGGQGSQGNKPNLGNVPGKKPDLGKGPGSVSSKKPDLGKGPGGAQDKRPGQQAALEGKKPDLGKGPQKARPGGNAFDASDGGKARDYAKRGQASLGSRSAGQFTKPSGGGGGHSVARGGGGSRGGGGGGGGHRGGGGGRRSDIRLKEDIVPLVRLSNGLELYRFRYKGSDRTAYVGVMAQEVQEIEPNAVWPDHNGYLMVNYDQIGLKFMTWKEWLARTSGGRQR
jgi:Protein of unknown function (DUF3300)/Chaperone of endosialidase